MAALSMAEAQAEVERRRVAAAVLAKARNLSKGQRFLLREVAMWRRQGYCPCGVVQERTTEILFERFGYLDRRRIERQETPAGVVPAYWLYTINEDGKRALVALGIQFEVDCPDCGGPDAVRADCATCHGTGKAPATADNVNRAAGRAALARPQENGGMG